MAGRSATSQPVAATGRDCLKLAGEGPQGREGRKGRRNFRHFRPPASLQRRSTSPMASSRTAICRD
jgi:hypothetical protein